LKRYLYILIWPLVLLLLGCEKEAMEIRRSPGTETDVSDDSTTTRLLTNATYELAAGYTYDPTLQMGAAVGYQIFNIQGLDKAQRRLGSSYIWDDSDAGTTQEVVTAHTQEDLRTVLQLSGSLGLSLYGTNVTVSGGFTKEDLESRTKEYGLMRLNTTCFSRDIQYGNVVADFENHPALDREVFTPVFAEERRVLQAYNSNNDYQGLRNKVHNFLLRWGCCFVSHSVMGCSLYYEVSVDKSVLNKEVTIDAALLASASKVLSAGGSIEMDNIYEKIENHYEYQLEARGGDVQLISLIHTGGALTNEMFLAWSKSLHTCEGQLADNAVLVSVHLVSMAQLFTDKVSNEMQRQIDNWPNY